MFNNTISLKKASNTTVNRNNNNNNTINKPFFNTTELYKNFSYDSSLKEGLKTTYQNKIDSLFWFFTLTPTSLIVVFVGASGFS